MNFRDAARSRRIAMVALQVLVVTYFTMSASAGAEEYFDADRQEWFDDASAKGVITTIGFNDLGADVLVTEQYADLGVHFTYLGNFTRGPAFPIFPRDGWGLDGNEMVHLFFDDPQTGIAFDFPGAAEVDLFLDGTLVHDSSRFGAGGADRFGGVFGVVFNEAIIVDWADDNVFLDDLHFVSIPAPPCLPLFFAGFVTLRLRRCRPR